MISPDYNASINRTPEQIFSAAAASLGKTPQQLESMGRDLFASILHHALQAPGKIIFSIARIESGRIDLEANYYPFREQSIRRRGVDHAESD